MPKIDFRKRRLDHTRFALDFATSLPFTPLLLEIYYPSPMPWADTPPSYYVVTRGIAVPIAREQIVNHVMKLTILPDKRMLWTK